MNPYLQMILMTNTNRAQVMRSIFFFSIFLRKWVNNSSKPNAELFLAWVRTSFIFLLFKFLSQGHTSLIFDFFWAREILKIKQSPQIRIFQIKNFLVRKTMTEKLVKFLFNLVRLPRGEEIDVRFFFIPLIFLSSQIRTFKNLV